MENIKTTRKPLHKSFFDFLHGIFPSAIFAVPVILLLASLLMLTLAPSARVNAAGKKQLIRISSTKSVLSTGQTARLKVKTFGIDNPEFTFKSENESLLTVDAYGLVQAVGCDTAAGEVIVTVKEVKSGKTAEKVFTVKPCGTSLEFSTIERSYRFDINSDGKEETISVVNNSYDSYFSDEFNLALNISGKIFELGNFYGDLERCFNFSFYPVSQDYALLLISSGYHYENYADYSLFSLNFKTSEAEIVEKFIEYLNKPVYGQKLNGKLLIRKEYSICYNIGRHCWLTEASFDEKTGKLVYSEISNVIQTGKNLKTNLDFTAYAEPGSSKAVFTLKAGDPVKLYRAKFSGVYTGNYFEVSNEKGELGWIKTDIDSNDYYVVFSGEGMDFSEPE